MGQKPFQWFRFSRSRQKRKPSVQADAPKPAHFFAEPSSRRGYASAHSPPATPSHLTEETYSQTLPQPFDPTLRESDTSGYSSANSSSVPFHSSCSSSRQTHSSPVAPTPQAPPAPPAPPVSPQPPAVPHAQRPIPRNRSRRSRPHLPKAPPSKFDNQHHTTAEQIRDWRHQAAHTRIAFRHPDSAAPAPSSSHPLTFVTSDAVNPASPVYSTGDPPSRPLDDTPLSFELNHLHSPSFASEANAASGQSSVANSAGDSVNVLLDNFVPHRPADRFVPPNYPVPPPAPDRRFSASASSTHSNDSANQRPGSSSEHRGGRYLKKLGDAHSRFIFRRKRLPQVVPQASPPEAPPPQDDYFGATQHDERGRSGEIRPGEEVLIRFLRNALGPKAQNLAVRLMNKTPITSPSGFEYLIHQGTEESDIEIIRRDLTSGRLYSSGVRLMGGAWCNLLLGDRFAPGSAPRQRHELKYRRSSCSCIICRVRTAEIMRAAESDARSQSDFGSDAESNGMSADVLSTMSTTSRTPIHSAMANFVVRYRLPAKHLLMGIGASSSSRELEIGSVVRLNYRTSAKFKFTEDVRELFGHYAYTGPISHEEVYRQVTTMGVHYYLYNKGKKERKVYIQGELIRLPINVGVIKLGTQPMYMPELGATFCLHRKQIVSIYVGEIVLEGNSIGSFINTGIQYYIGFGEERGVCPVYPNKTLGKARKLGINELLLHHHMVDDLEVKCL